MPTVLSLLPHLAGAGGIEQYGAMMDRKLAQQELGRRTAAEMREAAVALPSGNYAVVLDEGMRKVVLVMTSNIELVDGQMIASKFTETDQPPTYLKSVTKSNLVEDLGSYEVFTERHEPLWKLAMVSRNAPDAGLSMVQAIDQLVRDGVAANQTAVDTALTNFRIPDAGEILEKRRARLDAMLIQGLNGL